MLTRALIAAVVVEHVLLVIAPLDVLHPVDAWVVGRAIWHGHVPYRDFAFEYPPLAPLAFLLPGAVPHGLAPSVLALEAVAAEAAVVWFVLRRDTKALTRYLVLSLLVFPFMSGGFDALPMLAIALATYLLANSDGRGWIVASVGTLIKVTPGTAWLWARTHAKAAIAAALITTAVALVPLALSHHRDDNYIGYAVDRGVQVESMPATITWIGQAVTGRPHHFAYRFKSWELGGAGTAAAVTGALALLGAALLAVGAQRLDPRRASLIAVTLFILGSKVFSPQFMVWGAPLAAATGGTTFVAYAAAAALTFAAYAGPSTPTGIIVVAALRNAVLLAVLLHATKERAEARSFVMGDES